MIVRYSDVAIEDLTQVWSDVFTASCDVPTADKYTDGIFETIDKESLFPLSGVQIFYRGNPTGIRMIPFKAYLIFYRVKNDIMEVGRILPAKSDYLRLLFDEESGTVLMEDGGV